MKIGIKNNVFLQILRVEKFMYLVWYS